MGNSASGNIGGQGHSRAKSPPREPRRRGSLWGRCLVCPENPGFGPKEMATWPASWTFPSPVEPSELRSAAAFSCSLRHTTSFACRQRAMCIRALAQRAHACTLLVARRLFVFLFVVFPAPKRVQGQVTCPKLVRGQPLETTNRPTAAKLKGPKADWLCEKTVKKLTACSRNLVRVDICAGKGKPSGPPNHFLPCSHDCQPPPPKKKRTAYKPPQV